MKEYIDRIDFNKQRYVLAVPIEPNDVRRAEVWAKEVRTRKHIVVKGEEVEQELNNNIEPEALVIGRTGEIALARYYGIPDTNNTRNFDMRIGGLRAEVKTKLRTVKPGWDFACSVYRYNAVQVCDAYFYVSLQNWEVAWLEGWMTKEVWLKQRVFRPKNHMDGRYKEKADSWVVESHQLNNPDTLDAADF